MIALFIAFHVLAMKGVVRRRRRAAIDVRPVRYATQSTVNHMHAAWWVGYIVYPIGILASCYHLANGFWTAAITWGLTVSAAAQRRWGFACAGLFVADLRLRDDGAGRRALRQPATTRSRRSTTAGGGGAAAASCSKHSTSRYGAECEGRRAQ